MSIFWTLCFVSWEKSTAENNPHKQTNSSLNQTNKPINWKNLLVSIWCLYISVSKFYFELFRKQNTNVDLFVHPCSLNRHKFANPKNYTSNIYSLNSLFWKEIFGVVSNYIFSLKGTWLVFIGYRVLRFLISYIAKIFQVAIILIKHYDL